MSKHQEIETVLLIQSEKPLEVAQEILKLEKLHGYKIYPLPTQKIVDTYFDTPERYLKGHKLGARIRKLEEEGATQTLFTLKGSGSSHLEIEFPVPEDAKDYIENTLELDLVQTRKTYRRRRALKSWKDGEIKVEMCVDSTTYNFFDIIRKHHVVEFEAHGDTTKTVVDACSDALIKKFPKDLGKWNLSKTATGRLLELALVAVQADDGNINPIAYDALERLIAL